MSYRDTERAGAARTDEELMLAAQQDDHAAFAALVRRYEKPLYNYIRRMIRRESDAADVAQDAFMRVYAHRERYDASKPFRPWLYGIATNLCRDHGRYWRVRRWLSLDAAAGETEQPLGELLPDGAAGPDASAAAREELERIERAVAKLPEPHRAVFLLARYEGLSYAEIAETLGIPEGTVKSRMNTAVKRLLEAVEREQ